jgi:hypothetical protein
MKHMLNLKSALRTLVKTPFVTLVAILSLALGIGANAAIFSLFNQLALGRLLSPEDDRVIGESHVAVLSHASWETRFGRDPTVIDQQLIVNGQTLTIVGVAPRGFDGTTLGIKPQVYVPITMRCSCSPSATTSTTAGATESISSRG